MGNLRDNENWDFFQFICAELDIELNLTKRLETWFLVEINNIDW